MKLVVGVQFCHLNTLVHHYKPFKNVFRKKYFFEENYFLEEKFV
jgi:hypothetical protein